MPEGLPELMPADVERGAMEMMARDSARMRLAGGNLAEAAIRVIHDYDGLHRLSLAVAAWCEAVAAEGDRGARHSDLDAAIAGDVSRGLSLRQAAKRYKIGVGRVRGAVARAAQAGEAGTAETTEIGSVHEHAVPATSGDAS